MNRPERCLATLGSLRKTYPPGEEPPQLLVLEADAFAALSRWPAIGPRDDATCPEDATPENWQFLATAQQRAGQEQAAQLSLAEAQRLVALGPPTELPRPEPALAGDFADYASNSATNRPRTGESCSDKTWK